MRRDHLVTHNLRTSRYNAVPAATARPVTANKGATRRRLNSSLTATRATEANILFVAKRRPARRTAFVENMDLVVDVYMVIEVLYVDDRLMDTVTMCDG